MLYTPWSPDGKEWGTLKHSMSLHIESHELLGAIKGL